MDDLNGLLKAAELAGSRIKDSVRNKERILVVSHFDADGLASAGILARCLRALDANFQIHTVEYLSKEILTGASVQEYDTIIFSEIGSGYLDVISDDGFQGKTIILDHHQPNAIVPPQMTQVNPHDFGFQGSRDVSGSGIAYLTCRKLGEVSGLATLAVVGALGDMQDVGEERSLVGINRIILEEGIERGQLRAERDLLLFGRETQPLHRSMARTTLPYLPGLSGDEGECLNLILRAGIEAKKGERWRTPLELTGDERKRLTAAIEEATGNASGKERFNGTAYQLLNEEPNSPLRDARQYAFLLNACGGLEKFGLAISVCMGDRGAMLKEAEKLVAEYTRIIARLISLTMKISDRIQEGASAMILRGKDFIDAKMAGAISTVISSCGILGDEKVTLVVSKGQNGQLKISARGNDRLVERGVNLGAILHSLASKYSGDGGGHNNSAAALIPIEHEDGFLEELDSAIAQQLRPA